jgi:hypothetical protein
MRRILVALCFFVVSCSVPALTPEGKNVTVTANNQLTVGCALVGEIKAMDRNEVGDSKNELANQAAMMQGNLVLTTRKVDIYQYAEVYRCAASTLAPRVAPQP